MSLRRPDRRARLGRLAATALAAALATAMGCAHPSPDGAAGSSASERRAAEDGVVHVVRPGETIWRLAKRYGVAADDIVRANQIADVRNVAVGARLWIPDPADPSGSRTLPSLWAEEGPAVAGAPLGEADLAFAWPVRGDVGSGFGGRSRGTHDGIDIGAPKGTPVCAAEAGKVVYADEADAYGRVVVVRHLGGWSTLYAHNRKNRVREGQLVERGDVIGEVGTSGNASGPHVHFEIRRGPTSLDPLRYLP